MPEMELARAPRWVSAASRLIRSLPAGRYRAMNWVAGRGAPPFWTEMPADLGGFLFRCDLRDALMREVCITGRYEPQETVLLQTLLEPGMTFVDVGANWGYFTLGAAYLVGATGRVVSVEADPRASRMLGANVAQNRLGWVTVVAQAASDREETLLVRTYGSKSDDSSNFGVALAGALADGGQLFEIPARPLDAILDEARVERVHLLKMDIEGAEARALPGIRRRLAEGAVDRIILELHPAHLANQGASAEAVVSQLLSFGYRAWRINHSPRIHRLAASTRVSADSLLAPLTDAGELGRWPHLLFAREGFDRTTGHEAPRR